MHVVGCNFPEALLWIARNRGWPEPRLDPEVEARYKAVRSVTEVYAAVFADAMKDPEPALANLEGRGISRKTTEGIVGYLPPNYRPPDKDAALKAGLYSKGYFLFSDRLIIPIYQDGRIVSLYGRAVSPCDPKHKHHYPCKLDPPMPRTLWNLAPNRSVKAIFIAESIIDALAMIDCGFTNTVGLFGTGGLTDERVAALKRTSIEKVTLVFDSDANGAGQNGVMEAGEKLFRAGYEVWIVTLPLADGENKTDANSYLQKHTADDFQALEPRDFFDCLLESVPKVGNPQEIARAARKVLRVISSHPDELVHGPLLKKLRVRCPSLSSDVLTKELKAVRKKSKGALPLPPSEGFHPDPFADEILKNHHVIHHHGAYYFWSDGVYLEAEVFEVKRLIKPLGRGLFHKPHYDDILHSLVVSTAVRPEQVNRLGILNLANGYIDLMAETAELRLHTPKLLSTIQLPIAFAPDAQCPEFIRLLKEKAPDETLQLLLQEIAGYLLIPSAKYQKGFVLIGSTGTGKSTLIHILIALLGRANCSAIPLEKIGDRFELAGIDGKLANFSSEVSADVFLQDGPVKAIIAGDDMRGERKHQTPFTFKPYCRLVVGTNFIPLSHDTSDAFFRRWIPIPFNEQLPEEEWDRDLEDRIIANEMPGVLLWALAGLARLRKNDGFTQSRASQKALDQWKRDADPVREFAHRFLHPDKDSSVGLQKIFSSFNDWCKRTNRKSAFTDSNLRKKLEGAGFEFKRRNTGYALVGHWSSFDSRSDENLETV